MRLGVVSDRRDEDEDMDMMKTNRGVEPGTVWVAGRYDRARITDDAVRAAARRFAKLDPSIARLADCGRVCPAARGALATYADGCDRTARTAGPRARTIMQANAAAARALLPPIDAALAATGAA